MLISIPEAGNLSIHKIYKKLEKPARNLKIFSHKFCALFYFSENPHILPFLFFIFLIKPTKPHNSFTKIFHIYPSHSHFNFIFSSSFSFCAPPHFSQYIPPKHLHHAIHPFIYHFAINNIKIFLSSSLQKMPNTTPLLDSLHLSFISLFQIHFSLPSASAQTVIKNT